MKFLNLFKVAVVALGCIPSVKGASDTLLPPLYQRFPVGAVKPTGWALNQAQILADGLAGHLHDWYTYVNGSIWTGGTIEYSLMHEASPYWFNTLTGLAFQLEDDRLIGQVSQWLDYVLDHQQADGWIGPETLNPNSTVPRLVWPRYLALFGMIQFAEADPTQTTRIVDAMHKFIDLVYDLWRNNQYGTPNLGFQFAYQYVRWEELVYSLQWIYDFYPRGKEAQLLETMQMVKDTGYDWKSFYTDANFPKQLANSVMETHGVNNAEAMKSEALVWRFSQDPTDKDSTFKRIDLLYTYHGRESGTFAADEHLAGLNPSRGTETCDVVEQIFSLAIIYQFFGNNSVADRVEKLAFNALPGPMTPDFWGRQYDQQANQIWARNMTPTPFENSGYSNVFGLEPNYPCCTVNHPQGYPRYWTWSFLADQANTTLIHAFHGPSEFSTRLGNNDVQVSVDTIYPFGSQVKYTVKASQPFTFKIRVPEFAKTGKSTINVGGSTVALSPDDQSFHSVQISGGTTSFSVNFDMPLEVVTRSRGAVAINRGALNYVVEIPYNTTETLAWRNPQAASDAKALFPNAPAAYFTGFDNHAHDFMFNPTSPWQLAIDPNSIVVHDNSEGVAEMPYYVWAAGSPPVTMSAKACQIEWAVNTSTAAIPPSSPAACVGKVMNVTLAPYGATKLRLGEVPVMAV